MASVSSKALPFIVLAIALGLAIYEAESGKNVPLETMIPVLAAIGVAGVPLAAVKSIAEAKVGAKKAVEEFKESG